MQIYLNSWSPVPVSRIPHNLEISETNLAKYNSVIDSSLQNSLFLRKLTVTLWFSFTHLFICLFHLIKVYCIC